MSGMSQVNGNQSIGISIFIGVARNLEIIFKNFQFGTRRTRNLVGFIIRTILLDGTDHKSFGQNSGVLTKFQNKSQDSGPHYLQLAVD